MNIRLSKHRVITVDETDTTDQVLDKFEQVIKNGSRPFFFDMVGHLLYLCGMGKKRRTSKDVKSLLEQFIMFSDARSLLHVCYANKHVMDDHLAKESRSVKLVGSITIILLLMLFLWLFSMC